MDAILLDEITSAVREADDWFKKIGGSSRHWVDDCFLPMLKKRGIDIFKAQEVYDCESRLSAVEAERDRLKAENERLLRCLADYPAGNQTEPDIKAALREVDDGTKNKAE